MLSFLETLQFLSFCKEYAPIQILPEMLLDLQSTLTHQTITSLKEPILESPPKPILQLNVSLSTSKETVTKTVKLPITQYHSNSLPISYLPVTLPSQYPLSYNLPTQLHVLT